MQHESGRRGEVAALGQRAKPVRGRTPEEIGQGGDVLGELVRRSLTRSPDGLPASSVSIRVKTLAYRALNLFSKRSSSSSTPLTNSANSASAGRGASKAERCALPARPLGLPSPASRARTGQSAHQRKHPTPPGRPGSWPDGRPGLSVLWASSAAAERPDGALDLAEQVRGNVRSSRGPRILRQDQARVGEEDGGSFSDHLQQLRLDTLLPNRQHWCRRVVFRCPVQPPHPLCMVADVGVAVGGRGSRLHTLRVVTHQARPEHVSPVSNRKDPRRLL